jgi:hypothetical protein
MNKPPRPEFLVQLDEAKAEWERVKLSGGRNEDVRIAAVTPPDDGVRLRVDFGPDETALIEPWQILID